MKNCWFFVVALLLFLLLMLNSFFFSTSPHRQSPRSCTILEKDNRDNTFLAIQQNVNLRELKEKWIETTKLRFVIFFLFVYIYIHPFACWTLELKWYITITIWKCSSSSFTVILGSRCRRCEKLFGIGDMEKSSELLSHAVSQVFSSSSHFDFEEQIFASKLAKCENCNFYPSVSIFQSLICFNIWKVKSFI